VQAVCHQIPAKFKLMMESINKYHRYTSIKSHGPSPTPENTLLTCFYAQQIVQKEQYLPTMMIDNGKLLASTIACDVSLTLVTAPSAMITNILAEDQTGKTILESNVNGYMIRSKMFHNVDLKSGE
jgi:hypothetical protein